MPTKQEAWAVLFGGAQVPSSLACASFRFFSKLTASTQQLFAQQLPDAAGPLWVEIAVAAWRLEIALALPRTAEQDDAALRALIEDAVMARDALSFAHPENQELQEAIAETRAALFENWGLLLHRTANPPSSPGRAALQVGRYAAVEPLLAPQSFVGPAAVLTFAAATVWLLLQL